MQLPEHVQEQLHKQVVDGFAPDDKMEKDVMTPPSDEPTKPLQGLDPLPKSAPSGLRLKKRVVEMARERTQEVPTEPIDERIGHRNQRLMPIRHLESTTEVHRRRQLHSSSI